MKKVISLAILALLFSVSSFAQSKPVTAAKSVEKAAVVKSQPKAIEIKEFSGKVDSLAVADAAKKISAQLNAIDEKGAKITFIVAGKAMIMSAGQMITLDKISKDASVVVKYHLAANGANEATEITVK
jgi:hypothetical protein